MVFSSVVAFRIISSLLYSQNGILSVASSILETTRSRKEPGLESREVDAVSLLNSFSHLARKLKKTKSDEHYEQHLT